MTTRKPVRLWVKLGITMASVTVIALITATTLNFLRFEETYQRLIAQRLEVTAQEIARVVVTGLDLGLNVRAQDHLASFIETYEARHPEIGISVYECSGTPVIGSDAETGSRGWTDHAGASEWRVFGGERIVAGLEVDDNLGRCAAGITVATAADSYTAVMDTITERFAVTAALAAATACLVILGALFLFSRRSNLRKLDDDLLRLAQTPAGDGASPALPVTENDFSDPWERMLVRHYLDARPNLAGRAPRRREEDAS